MQWALAALALHPQVTVAFFVELELLFSLYVDFFHPTFAVAAGDLLGAAQKVLAAKARFLHFSEFEETHIWVTHGWLENVPHVVSWEQDLLSTVSHYWLKDTDQWLL